MKKLFSLFTIVVLFTSFTSCGTSPDHSVDSVSTYLEQNRYYKVLKTIPVFSNLKDPYIRVLEKQTAKEKTAYFNYIAVVKNSDGGIYVVFLLSEKDKIEVVEEISIE